MDVTKEAARRAKKESLADSTLKTSGAAVRPPCISYTVNTSAMPTLTVNNAARTKAPRRSSRFVKQMDPSQPADFVLHLEGVPPRRPHPRTRRGQCRLATTSAAGNGRSFSLYVLARDVEASSQLRQRGHGLLEDFGYPAFWACRRTHTDCPADPSPTWGPSAPVHCAGARALHTAPSFRVPPELGHAAPAGALHRT